MPSSEPSERFSLSQWVLLLVLASVQFVHIVDFLILMPLFPHLERDLGISPKEFGGVVSAYGIAACVSSLLLAPWLDRFDRKPTLLVLFSGFTVGTLFCAAAPNWWTLLAGRTVAGAFGGVAGSVVNAIVGDAFPASRRGTAMGVVMSAFSIASIAGVPLGLKLANLPDQGWRSPFAVLGAAGFGILLFGFWVMPSIVRHLEGEHEPAPLWQVMSRPAHLPAFGLILLLAFSSFLIFPYVAAYLVKNVGRTVGELELVYVYGGTATLLSMNLVGRLSDRFSRLLVFRVMAISTIVPMVTLTCLPGGTSLAATLTVTTMLFILSSGRMVPAMAMITSCAEPRIRGSFMSLIASVQQLGMGLAPLVTGMFLSNGPDGGIVGYPIAGVLTALVGLASVAVVGMLRPAEAPAVAPTAAWAEEPLCGIVEAVPIESAGE